MGYFITVRRLLSANLQEEGTLQLLLHIHIYKWQNSGWGGVIQNNIPYTNFKRCRQFRDTMTVISVVLQLEQVCVR